MNPDSLPCTCGGQLLPDASRPNDVQRRVGKPPGKFAEIRFYVCATCGAADKRSFELPDPGA